MNEDVAGAFCESVGREALSPAVRLQLGPKVATSTYRGVCWHRKSLRWQAAINSAGRHVYLGSFDTEEEAARAFDKVALRVRGAKAKLNFPIEEYLDPDGNPRPEPKLEPLAREARRALQDKQRAQAAAAEAGRGGKRRRHSADGEEYAAGANGSPVARRQRGGGGGEMPTGAGDGGGGALGGLLAAEALLGLVRQLGRAGGDALAGGPLAALLNGPRASTATAAAPGGGSGSGAHAVAALGGLGSCLSTLARGTMPPQGEPVHCGGVAVHGGGGGAPWPCPRGAASAQPVQPLEALLARDASAPPLRKQPPSAQPSPPLPPAPAPAAAALEPLPGRVAALLAAVGRLLPPGAAIDRVIPTAAAAGSPCAGLLGYTYGPEAGGADYGAGQGGAGRYGAGVWVRGGLRDLGTYTLREDALQACQACMSVLLETADWVQGLPGASPATATERKVDAAAAEPRPAAVAAPGWDAVPQRTLGDLAAARGAAGVRGPPPLACGLGPVLGRNGLAGPHDVSALQQAAQQQQQPVRVQSELFRGPPAAPIALKSEARAKAGQQDQQTVPQPPAQRSSELPAHWNHPLPRARDDANATLSRLLMSLLVPGAGTAPAAQAPRALAAPAGQTSNAAAPLRLPACNAPAREPREVAPSTLDRPVGRAGCQPAPKAGKPWRRQLDPAGAVQEHAGGPFDGTGEAAMYSRRSSDSSVGAARRVGDCGLLRSRSPSAGVAKGSGLDQVEPHPEAASGADAGCTNTDGEEMGGAVESEPAGRRPLVIAPRAAGGRARAAAEGRMAADGMASGVAGLLALARHGTAEAH